MADEEVKPVEEQVTETPPTEETKQEELPLVAATEETAETEQPAEAAAEPESAADEPEAEPAAEEATADAAVHEPMAEAASDEPTADAPADEAEAPAAPEKKRKKKRLPRALRPARSKPKHEKPAERKPIVRLEKPEHARGRRQERQGTVVSSASDKTIVVRVDVVKIHPRYKKVIRRSAKFHAHDETNQAKVGDLVKIVETRPLSRMKRWRLQEIVRAAK